MMYSPRKRKSADTVASDAAPQNMNVLQIHTDESVLAIARNCPLLENLYLGYEDAYWNDGVPTWYFTDTSIIELAEAYCWHDASLRWFITV